MRGPTIIFCIVIIVTGALLISGCATLVGTAGHSAAASPSTQRSVAASASDSQAKTDSTAKFGSITGPVISQIAGQPVAQTANQAQNPACVTPAGWVAYLMQTNETVFSIAARAGITATDMLVANCLTSVTQVAAGSWIAVPPGALATQPQTILPLGISAFVADPVQASAGSPVTVVWQAQGPVVAVRVGWLYQGQFIEEAANLPAMGTWTLTAPDDGRGQITYMVRASDGLSEVAAQTTVQITCAEGWFFAPTPLECPSPPVVTTFQEQPFERGSIVYIPALRVHYVLVQGHPGRQVADQFVPGMPLRDPALDGAIPAGLYQPQGAIHYAWRSDALIMTGLGYATGPARTYTGMLQRLIATGGETVYFSSSAGTIYRFTDGQMWRVLIAQ